MRYTSGQDPQIRSSAVKGADGRQGRYKDRKIDYIAVLKILRFILCWHDKGCAFCVLLTK
jgi:hypothetical protein